ncbi:MAG: SCO family protein [Caulobacteraceae bacterium]
MVFSRAGLGMIFLVAFILAGCEPRRPAASNIGGPFRMTDQDGVRVDQRLLRGKWSAVYFGYTFCPDACPTTLTALGHAQNDLGREAADVQFVFVTVDPARDTPAEMKSYLSSPAFPKGTIGLTGSAADIAATARAYHVYYRREGAGKDYSMDHTSVVYLMNPKGVFDRPLDTTAPPRVIAGQIAAAMNGSEG